MADSPRTFRTAVFIDGFNLYFGLKSLGKKRYYWLDALKLAASLVKTPGVLAETKYFTALISGPADKARRQLTFLEANELMGLTIIHGKYQENAMPCCGKMVSQEKKTDVNIAVQLMADAYRDRFDTAILVSGDSDLVPAVVEVRNLFKKAVVIAFPPNRPSKELAFVATASFHIIEKHLRTSMLPETLTKPDGYELRRPERWQ